jgi:hypothetical protein
VVRCFLTFAGAAVHFVVFRIAVVMFMVVFMSVHHAIMAMIVIVEKLIKFALFGLLVI